MDKYTTGKLVWLMLTICCFLALWSNVKSWADGEVTHSGTGSFKFRTFKREDDPSKFALYMLAMFTINAIGFVVVAIIGVFAFLL